MSQPSEQPWWEQEGLPEAASRFLSSADCPKGLQASLHDLLSLLRVSEKEKALLEVLRLPSTWTRPSPPALDTALLRGENVEAWRSLLERCFTAGGMREEGLAPCCTCCWTMTSAVRRIFQPAPPGLRAISATDRWIGRLWRRSYELWGWRWCAKPCFPFGRQCSKMTWARAPRLSAVRSHGTVSTVVRGRAPYLERQQTKMALGGAIYTQSMRKNHPCTSEERFKRFRRWRQQGYCCCFYWPWRGGKGAASPPIRAGAFVLAAGEEPAQLSIPQMARDLWRQLLSVTIALLGISLVSANVYFSPYRGEDSAPFVNLSNTISGISLCSFAALALLAAENLFQTLPHFYYSAYLEPLCAALRLNRELAPQQLDSVTVHNPLASHTAPSETTSRSLVNLHFFCGAAAPTLVKNLVSFLKSGFGFEATVHNKWNVETIEHEVKGEECGIYVFFLQTKDECTDFLDAVHPAPPQSRILADWCAIPVALLPDCERSPAFKEVLFVEGFKKAGESLETEKRILISIARRMAAVLTWGHKLHK